MRSARRSPRRWGIDAVVAVAPEVIGSIPTQRGERGSKRAIVTGRLNDVCRDSSAACKGVALSKQTEGSPATHGRLLDIGALKLGDVILSSTEHLVSTLIKDITSSAYSHASIYLGDGVIFESNDDGVRPRPIQMLRQTENGRVVGAPYADWTTVVVLRRDDVPEANWQRAIHKIVKEQIGNDYPPLAVVGDSADGLKANALSLGARVYDTLQWLSNKDPSAHEAWCSRLVGLIVADALALHGEERKQIESATPAELHRRALALGFREVPNAVMASAKGGDPARIGDDDGGPPNSHVPEAAIAAMQERQRLKLLALEDEASRRLHSVYHRLVHLDVRGIKRMVGLITLAVVTSAVAISVEPGDIPWPDRPVMSDVRDVGLHARPSCANLVQHGQVETRASTELNVDLFFVDLPKWMVVSSDDLVAEAPGNTETINRLPGSDAVGDCVANAVWEAVDGAGGSRDASRTKVLVIDSLDEVHPTAMQAVVRAFGRTLDDRAGWGLVLQGRPEAVHILVEQGALEALPSGKTRLVRLGIPLIDHRSKVEARHSNVSSYQVSKGEEPVSLNPILQLLERQPQLCLDFGHMSLSKELMTLAATTPATSAISVEELRRDMLWHQLRRNRDSHNRPKESDDRYLAALANAISDVDYRGVTLTFVPSPGLRTNYGRDAAAKVPVRDLLFNSGIIDLDPNAAAAVLRFQPPWAPVEILKEVIRTQCDGLESDDCRKWAAKLLMVEDRIQSLQVPPCANAEEERTEPIDDYWKIVEDASPELRDSIFDLTKGSIRVLVIYGVGGSGKSHYITERFSD
jgi:hypothetical protein